MPQEINPHVGQRLRAFRERQGLSLRALAELCGLSINAISRIERGENSPTVSSLNRLATALRVPITDFFLEKPNQGAVYIKSGGGLRVNSNGFVAEHLGVGLNDQQMEPMLVTIEPHSESSSTSFTHPGQEFVLCLAGSLEYIVNDQIFLLQEGDSLLLESMQPHCWRNGTLRPAVILLVFQAAQDNSLARQRHRTG